MSTAQEEKFKPIAVTDYELRALREFVSYVKTRPYLCVVWQYLSDGGCTHVATDGHTIALRREGTHVTMSLHDIAELPPQPLDLPRDSTCSKPVRWETVINRPSTEGKNLDKRGINPAYFARVACVEAAAGRRRADDFVPHPRMTDKEARIRKAELKSSAWSEWSIPCSALDGWYWVIPGQNIQWEGVIVPRRV